MKKKEYLILEYDDGSGNGFSKVGEYKTQKDLFKAINEKTPNAPYYRYWAEPGYFYVDFGSHSQFYRFKEVKE